MITSALEFLRGQEVNNNNFLLFGDEPKLIFYIKKRIKSTHTNYERVVISIEEKNFDEQLEVYNLLNKECLIGCLITHWQLISVIFEAAQ